MPLSRIEKETVIIYNEAENVASVSTCNPRLKSRLGEFARKNTDCCLRSEDDESQTYVLPKAWIKINLPRQYSEEQRAAMAKRARKHLFSKKE